MNPKKVHFHIRHKDSLAVEKTVQTTPGKADRVERGLLRQLDTERFYLERVDPTESQPAPESAEGEADGTHDET